MIFRIEGISHIDNTEIVNMLTDMYSDTDISTYNYKFEADTLKYSDNVSSITNTPDIFTFFVMQSAYKKQYTENKSIDNFIDKYHYYTTLSNTLLYSLNINITAQITSEAVCNMIFPHINKIHAYTKNSNDIKLQYFIQMEYSKLLSQLCDNTYTSVLKDAVKSEQIMIMPNEHSHACIKLVSTQTVFNEAVILYSVNGHINVLTRKEYAQIRSLITPTIRIPFELSNAKKLLFGIDKLEILYT